MKIEKEAYLSHLSCDAANGHADASFGILINAGEGFHAGKQEVSIGIPMDQYSQLAAISFGHGALKRFKITIETLD